MIETNTVLDRKPRKVIGPVHEKKIIVELEICRLERELHAHMAQMATFQSNVAVGFDALKSNDQRLWDRGMLMLGLSVFINMALAIRLYFSM